ncbi:MAG: hypothetical protein JXR64_02920 [Spirochaetales bacterium]|nr:hypothetical protein [Spirochaetales bacterium]
MANTDFIFFLDTEDSLLYLKDLTDYPIDINNGEISREDFGIAFSYTFGDWETGIIVTDLTNFFDIVNIFSSAGGIARFKIFIIKQYREDYNYFVGELAYYEDNFYVANTLTGNLPTHSDWNILEPETAHNILVNGFSVEIDSLYASFDLICEVPLTPYYSLIRKGNYDYEVRNNFEGLVTTIDINLYKYNNEFLWEVENNTFTLIEDGVYKVVINCIVNGNEDQLILIVDNFYSFEVCSRKLVDTLLCEGDDCSKLADINKKINEFSNLYFAIYMNLSVEKIRFYGLLDDEAEMDDYISTVGLLIDKMKLLVNQCKSC